MTARSTGRVLCGVDGCVHIRIGDERYYLRPEDLGRLFFLSVKVPLFRKDTFQDSPGEYGCVYPSPSGRAVVIAKDKQHYLLPRDRFLSIALGEEFSCPLFEVPKDGLELIPLFPARQGGFP
ncbi:MAG: hypothetical protein WC586_06435 [Methanoregula sp.]